MASFRTTVYVGTVNGKKQRKTVTAKSKRELNRKVMELKLQVARGKDCYTKATFGQWAEKWMAEVVGPKGLSPGAIRKYESALKHLNRAFRDVRLRDIHLSDMQQFINELALRNPNTGKPASKETLTNIKKVGNAVFRYARQNNVEGVPDFFGVLQIPVNAPVGKRRALTLQELDAVLGVPHWAQPMAMVMLFCGLRMGECVPLRWEDIDFERRVLWVRRSADLQRNGPVVKEGGKTSAAKRLVPMPDVLVEYLEWYRGAVQSGEFAGKCGARVRLQELGLADAGPEETSSEWKASGKTTAPETTSASKAYFALHPTPSYKRPPREGISSPLVFPTIRGEMHSKSSMRRLWEDYLRELNEAASPMHFTPHDLRHTYATILYLQDVDIRDAMAYMGHTTYQVTLGIYTDNEQYCRFDMDPALRTRLKTDFHVPKREW